MEQRDVVYEELERFIAEKGYEENVELLSFVGDAFGRLFEGDPLYEGVTPLAKEVQGEDGTYYNQRTIYANELIKTGYPNLANTLLTDPQADYERELKQNNQLK